MRAAFIVLPVILLLSACSSGPSWSQLKAEGQKRLYEATALAEDAAAAARVATEQAHVWSSPTPLPTSTPWPTATPLPTITPTPTETPQPTATATPIVIVVTVNVTAPASEQATKPGQQLTTVQVLTLAFALLVVVGALAAVWWFVWRPRERVEPK